MMRRSLYKPLDGKRIVKVVEVVDMGTWRGLEIVTDDGATITIVSFGDAFGRGILSDDPETVQSVIGED